MKQLQKHLIWCSENSVDEAYPDINIGNSITHHMIFAPLNTRYQQAYHPRNRSLFLIHPNELITPSEIGAQGQEC